MSDNDKILIICSMVIALVNRLWQTVLFHLLQKPKGTYITPHNILIMRSDRPVTLFQSMSCPFSHSVEICFNSMAVASWPFRLLQAGLPDDEEFDQIYFYCMGTGANIIKWTCKSYYTIATDTAWFKHS